jgi:hypothetical protein
MLTAANHSLKGQRKKSNTPFNSRACPPSILRPGTSMQQTAGNPTGSLSPLLLPLVPDCGLVDGASSRSDNIAAAAAAAVVSSSRQLELEPVQHYGCPSFSSHSAPLTDIKAQETPSSGVAQETPCSGRASLQDGVDGPASLTHEPSPSFFESFPSIQRRGSRSRSSSASLQVQVSVEGCIIMAGPAGPSLCKCADRMQNNPELKNRHIISHAAAADLSPAMQQQQQQTYHQPCSSSRRRRKHAC